MAVYSGPGFVLYEGTPVLQSSMVSMDVQTDNKDVNTQLLGWAGFSPGPKKVQISVNSAIPAAGSNTTGSPSRTRNSNQPRVQTRGKTYSCSGDIRNAKLDSSVDKANEVSFEFHGTIISTTQAVNSTRSSLATRAHLCAARSGLRPRASAR